MKIDILGVKVNKITSEEVIQRVGEWLEKKEKHYIVTPNPEFVMYARQDQEFKNILNKADLAIPDGIGLLWAAKFLSLNVSHLGLIKYLQALWQFVYTKLSLVFFPRYCQTVFPERVTGTDLVWKLAKLAEQKSCSIYLLGGRGNTAQLTAQKLKQKFPHLKIAGAFAGSPDKEADKNLCAIINHVKPDILLVAYGHPKQEKWIKRNLDKLPSVKVVMGVGGAFDFITGKVKRAPQFLRKLGLEWLWRFFIQPWRVKRIFIATLKFSWTVFKHKIKR